MDKKRLFIGTFVESQKFIEGYKKIINDFNPYCFGKWVEMENLHFTYQFLGDVENQKIPEVINSVSNLLTKYESSFILKGLDVFPKIQSPKILFVNVINNDRKILEIYRNLDEELHKLGFEKDKKVFKPHLTLQRIKSVNDDFRKILPKYSQVEYAVFHNFSVSLVESQLTQKGPIYKIIK